MDDGPAAASAIAGLRLDGVEKPVSPRRPPQGRRSRGSVAEPASENEPSGSATWSSLISRAVAAYSLTSLVVLMAGRKVSALSSPTTNLAGQRERRHCHLALLG